MVHCVVNVTDDMSLSVNPDEHLERGMTININFTVRYGGPTDLSYDQDPSLSCTLDNRPVLPTIQIHYKAPADTDNLHTKTLVISIRFELS